MSANLELESKETKALRLDVNWTPEVLKQWIRDWNSNQISSSYSSYSSKSSEVLNEVLEEISQKSSLLSQQMANDVILPLISLISDEFGDLFEELVNNFGPIRRFLEVSEQLFEDISRSLEQILRNLYNNRFYENFGDFYRQTARNVRKQCKRFSPCYQLVYSLENYGIHSLQDWLHSNALEALKQSHRLVMTTSGRLYRYSQQLPVPEWVSDWNQYYRESVRDFYQSIIESNPQLYSIIAKVEELFEEVVKEWKEMDSQKVKSLSKEVLSLIFASDKTSSRVVVWDPQNGRLLVEIKSPVLTQ